MQNLLSKRHALSQPASESLIAILLTLGVAITAYQIFVQGIPVTEAETDDLWNIDAKVDFVATPKPRSRCRCSFRR